MPTTRRQSKSATKIQAATRGRQTRRKLKSNKSSRKSSPKSSPKECPICLEEVNKDNASIIQCENKHLYHDKCIKQWMEHKTECPICKADLEEEIKTIDAEYEIIDDSEDLEEKESTS